MAIFLISNLEPYGDFKIVDAEDISNLPVQVRAQLGQLTAAEIQNDTAGDAKLVTAATLHDAIDAIVPTHGVVVDDDTIEGSGITTDKIRFRGIPTFSSTTTYTNGATVRYGNEVWFFAGTSGVIGGRPSLNAGWVRLDNQISDHSTDDHYRTGQLVKVGSDVWLTLAAVSPGAAPTADSTSWYKLTGRLTTIHTDATIDGDGQSSSTALSVAADVRRPAQATGAELTELTGNSAVRSFSPDNIQAMIGGRLSNLPDGGLASVSTDGTIDGDGTTNTPLSVNPTYRAPAGATNEETTAGTETGNRLFSPNQIRSMVHRHAFHEAPTWTSNTSTNYVIGSLVKYQDSVDDIYDVYALNDNLTSVERARTPLIEPKWIRLNNTMKTWSGTTIHHKGDIVQHDSHLWFAVSDTLAGNEPGSAAVWVQIDKQSVAQLRTALGQIDADASGIKSNTSARLISGQELYAAIDAELTSHGTGGGITHVETDATIDGDGSNATGDELSVNIGEVKTQIGALTSAEIIAGTAPANKLVSAQNMNTAIDSIVESATGRVVTSVGSDDVSVATGNEWHDTGFAVPSGNTGDLEFLFDVTLNPGGTTTDFETYVLRVRKADFFALTAQAADSTISNTDNTHFSVPTGAVLGHVIKIGRTTGNNVLVGSAVPIDFNPMKVRTITYNVAGGGGGDTNPVEGTADELTAGTVTALRSWSPSVLNQWGDTLGGQDPNQTRVATLQLTEIGNANVDVTTVHELVATGITVPSGTTGDLEFNLDLGNAGTVSEDEDGNPVNLTLRVTAQQFFDLEPETAGDTISSSGNSRFYSIVGRQYNYTIGRTANNEVLFTSSHVGFDVWPLTVNNIQYIVPVVQVPAEFADISRTQLWTGDVDIATADRWTATGYTLTETDGELIFNVDVGEDPGSTDITEGITQLRVLAADWNALAAVTANTTPYGTSIDNSMFSLFVPSGTTSRRLYFGKSATGEVMFATSHAGVNAVPLTIYSLKYRAFNQETPTNFANAVKTQIAQSNINITGIQQFQDTNINIPQTDGELIFNIDVGTSGSTDNNGNVLQLRVLTEDWRGLRASGPTDSTTGHDNNHFTVVRGTGNNTFEYYIGRSAANNVLVASSGTVNDMLPLTVSHLQYRAVIGSSGGGGSLYQGAWNNTTAYTTAQMVLDHDNLYVAVTDIASGGTAPHLETDTTKWAPALSAKSWPTGGDTETFTKFEFAEYNNRVYLHTSNVPTAVTATQTPLDVGIGSHFHLVGLPPRITAAQITTPNDNDGVVGLTSKDLERFIDAHVQGERAVGFAEPVVTELHSSNVNIETARNWVGTGYVLTHTNGELVFKFNVHNAPSTTDEVIAIKRVLVTDFLALAASTAGSDYLSANIDNSALVVSTSYGSGEHEYFIGRTALNEVLITSNSNALDSYPLVIDHLQYRAVAPVGGGVTETEFYNEVVDIATALSYYVAPNSNGWTSYDEIQIEIQIGGGHDEANTTPIKFLTSTLTELDATTSGAAADKPYIGIAMPRFDGDGIRVGASSIGIAKDADNNLMFARLNDFGETNVKIIGITYNAGQGKTPLSAANIAAGTSTEAGPVSPKLLADAWHEDLVVRNSTLLHISNTANRGRVLTPFGNHEFDNDTPGPNYRWAKYDELRFVFNFDYDTSVAPHTSRIHDERQGILESDFMRVFTIANKRPLWRVADTAENALNAQGSTTFVHSNGGLNMQGTQVSNSWRLGVGKLLNRGWYLGRVFLPHLDENADSAQSACVDVFMTKLDQDTYAQLGFLFVPRTVGNTGTIESITENNITELGLRSDIVITRADIWGYRHSFKATTHAVYRVAGLEE